MPNTPNKINLIFVLFTITLIPLCAAQEIGIKDLKLGAGELIQRHDQVSIHYQGWLSNGSQFYSSYESDSPITLTRGTGKIMPSWDQGIAGMRVGGKREITAPPHLAFGQQGVPGIIPKNETVTFEIEILARHPAPFTSINPKKLIELQHQGAILIDIRRTDEWQRTGVIKGSLLSTAFDKHDRFIKTFREQVDLHTSPNDTIVLICRSGVRTGLIARALVEQMGYTRVYNLENGILEWLKQDREVYRNCLFETGSYC